MSYNSEDRKRPFTRNTRFVATTENKLKKRQKNTESLKQVLIIKCSIFPCHRLICNGHGVSEFHHERVVRPFTSFGNAFR